MKIKITLITLLAAWHASAQVQTIGNPHNTVTANGRLTADSGYVFTARDSAAINAVAAKYNYSTKAHNDSTYATKTNTVTINGNTQALGSNPAFTVAGGGALYPGYGTRVRGGDSVDVDTSIIAVKGTPNAIFDTLYNKANWNNLTDFLTNGAIATAAGVHGIAITNGSGTLTKSLDINQYSLLEKWILDATFKVGAKNSGSYGVGLGMRSYNSLGTYDAIGRVDLSSTISGGQVMLNLGYNDPQATVSTTNLSFSVGDIIELNVERDEGMMSVWARNLTTNSSRVSCSFTYPLTFPEVYQTHNTGKPGVFTVGTEIDTLKSLSYISKHSYRPNILIVTDSKGLYYNSGFYNTWPSKLAKNFQDVECTRGGYDRTIEVLERMPEILRWAPKNVLLNIGSNDIRSGVSSSVYLHNYDSIVSILTSAGIGVYMIAQIPETAGLDQHLLYNHIMSTYPASHVFDPTAVMSEPGMISSSDGIHMTDSGNETLYRFILYGGKLPNPKVVGVAGEAITKFDLTTASPQNIKDTTSGSETVSNILYAKGIQSSGNMSVGGVANYITSGYSSISGGGSNGLLISYAVGGSVNYITNNDAYGWQVYCPDNGHIPFRINHSNDSVHLLGPMSIPGNTYINGHLNLIGVYIPSSSGDGNGNNGDISYDSAYIYIKSGGSWRRATLSTF